MIAAFLYKLGAFLALRLPKGISERITQFLADLQYLFRIKVRRAVRENLKIVHGGKLGKKELRRRTRRVFRFFGKSIYLFLRMPQLEIEDLKATGDSAGFRELAEDLTKKSGFIVVSAHLGPWEMGGVWLAANELKVNTVALDHPAEAVTAFFNKRRELSGLKIFPMRGSFGDLKEALERSECVALIVDRDYGGAGKHCRWFGIDTKLPIGHLLLAYRCRVPVLTGAFVFDSSGGLRCVIKRLHHPDTSLSEEDAVTNLQKECLKDLEELIETYSDQWFQFYPLKASRD